MDHFKNSSNIDQGNVVPDDENHTRTDTVYIEQLDKPFSVNEVSKTISSLKRHNSCDFSNNISDLFISRRAEARDFYF